MKLMSDDQTETGPVVDSEQGERITDSIEPDLELLIFQLGSEYFALDITEVEEIKIPPVLTPVPRSKNFVLGITTLRGTLFPVIDLALFFNMMEAKNTIDARVIIFDCRDEMIGFYVDRVIGVRKKHSEEIKAINEAMNLDREFYRGVFDFNASFCSYLDLQKILASPRLKKFYSERDET